LTGFFKTLLILRVFTHFIMYFVISATKVYVCLGWCWWLSHHCRLSTHSNYSQCVLCR